MQEKKIKKELGERIKKTREALGLSQIEMAKFLEVTNTNITRYEQGKTIPKGDFFVKLFSIFNVNPWYIFRGEPPVLLIKENKKNLSNLIVRDSNRENYLQDKTLKNLEEWIKLYFDEPEITKVVLKVAKFITEIKKELQLLLKAGIPYERAILYIVLEKL